MIDAANNAFVTAMHWTAGIGTLVTAFGVLMVLKWMPGKAAAHQVEPTPATAPELAEVS
ncbi:hypothetical protein Prum_017360 [Phytohabitans rumicis]|uniref:Uncharacterized protein n=1 Tax=Phytohabitans rumicis TaxID=1076125 RepID=A0A6V8KW85_9ACTN|nr:hypothetical protein Prum_017360 [Phytohabitans rumicis]